MHSFQSLTLIYSLESKKIENKPKYLPNLRCDFWTLEQQNNMEYARDNPYQNGGGKDEEKMKFKRKN